VLHDWGSVAGFDWARQHHDRVQGIAFMEGIVTPSRWAHFPDDVVNMFRGFRSPAGEHMVLEQNLWIEGVLPALIQRQLSDEEMDHYRQPFASPGEDRRPTLSWPRHLPVEGDPADVAAIVNEYGNWLAGSSVPKLFINAEPGEIINDRVRDIIRTWPSLTEATASGRHFIQEDSPGEIGQAIAQFVRGPRAPRCRSPARIRGRLPEEAGPRAQRPRPRLPGRRRPGSSPAPLAASPHPLRRHRRPRSRRNPRPARHRS
jgi:haloalkane dehalogenase